MKIEQNVTIESIRMEKPALIFYSTHTPWWTHDPKDLCRREGVQIPLDPLGAPLFQTEKVEEFLKSAEENSSHYGKHGLRAFMAAHAKNCIDDIRGGGRTGAFHSWDAYNHFLDIEDEIENYKNRKNT